MKHRKLALTESEEEEFKVLLEAGALNEIAEEYCVSYREAYFIRKGKITPSYAVDNTPITRWF